jgi:hypothetical protein
MYKNGKMRPGMREGMINKNDRGGEFNYDIL